MLVMATSIIKCTGETDSQGVWPSADGSPPRVPNATQPVLFYTLRPNWKRARQDCPLTLRYIHTRISSYTCTPPRRRVLKNGIFLPFTPKPQSVLSVIPKRQAKKETVIEFLIRMTGKRRITSQRNEKERMGRRLESRRPWCPTLK